MTKQRIEIVDWDTHYEVSQSRRTQLHKWVAIPNKHDGRGYSRIAMMPDGAEIFCAWILIVQVASKMPKRGVLADSNGPLSISDIAVKTRYPEKLFQKAVKILAGENIGWLRVVGHQSERSRSGVGAMSEIGGTAIGAQSELHDITGHDITGHDITGHDITGHDISAPRSAERNAVPADLFLTYPCNGQVKEFHLPMSKVNEWSMLYSGLDVAAECKKALAWIGANPGKRKTAKGMQAFLVNWLGRANDRGGQSAKTTKPRTIQDTMDIADQIIARLDGQEVVNG